MKRITNPESISERRGRKQFRTSSEEETRGEEQRLGQSASVLSFQSRHLFVWLSLEWEAGNQMKEALKAALRSLVLILPGCTISDTVSGPHRGNYAHEGL